ncbi:response regulator [Endozoicomonas sp. SM1973]|uniref:Response regulator n=1 Tax=Spartinivicinus marinus TaxID=2994442 RepID=A0A853HUD8_9GAMM|nr:SpoIIE family protein phosphatase [Spartinivicinus marinus]MCX4029036.1 response regulator [Spartinivicinus marinus]NYZ65380.1 response regulator [Spartinivicinus marinus]
MAVESNTLLVIDDETTVRESVVAYLEDSGFTILEAGNGAHGLEVFDQHQPDLVICDLRMPKLDGLGVLKKIRETSPETPVIVVSGAGVMTDVVEALRLGASDYLIKPIVDLEVLEHAVNRALENAQLVKDNQRYRESLEEAIQTLRESLEELQADQKAGRQVQMKMLPATPYRYLDYQLSHHISPSLYLSGDFVDYFRLSEHQFAFYLADVSGHGASSAFVTVLLKHMSTRLKREYTTRKSNNLIKPSEMFSYINRGLLNTDLGKHVTMFGGIVDTKANTLTYAFGGHFPFPILATDKEVAYLEGYGLPVGLFDDATYNDFTMELPEKFALITFSDGIIEVLPHAKLKDKEEYLLSVIRGGAITVEALIEALELEQLKDAPDDIAVLVLARNMS